MTPPLVGFRGGGDPAVPKGGTFNVLGAGAHAAHAIHVARELPERVLALVLESPTGLAADDLRGLATPHLVVLGTRDDIAAPALGPRGHLVYVYDAGRSVAADRPGAFTEVVTDFLRSEEHTSELQ